MKHFTTIFLIFFIANMAISQSNYSKEKPQKGDFFVTMDGVVHTNVKIKKGKTKWLNFYDKDANKHKFNTVKLYRKNGKEFLTNGVSGKGNPVIHQGAVSIYIEKDTYMTEAGKFGSLKKYFMIKGFGEVELITPENTRKLLSMKKGLKYEATNAKVEKYLKRAEKAGNSKVARGSYNSCIKAIKAYNKVY